MSRAVVPEFPQFQARRGSRDAGRLHRHGGAVADGRDVRSQLPQDSCGALDVGAGQQAFEAGSCRERAPPASRARCEMLLSPGGRNDTSYLHASACRRHWAARLSHAVRAGAFPVSRARSSSPNGSSRARSTGSIFVPVMSRISDQSPGSLDARRVVFARPRARMSRPGAGPGRRRWREAATPWPAADGS